MAPGVTSVAYELKVPLPDEVATLLSRDMVGDILRRLAATLYAERKISFGAAARLAGVSYTDFFGVLATYGLHLNYTEEDLVEDVRTLKELGLYDSGR